MHLPTLHQREATDLYGGVLWLSQQLALLTHIRFVHSLLCQSLLLSLPNHNQDRRVIREPRYFWTCTASA